VLYRVEMPGDDHGAAVRAAVASWLEHPALHRIVEAEGGAWPAGSLLDRARMLHEFSARWDRRSGAERLNMAPGDIAMDIDELMDSAGQLGLTVAARPTGSVYDHGLTLGGTALASIFRVKHLLGLRDSGVEMKAIGILTALRDVGVEERALVAQHPDLSGLAEPKSEFDVMVAAAAHFTGEQTQVDRVDDDNPCMRSATARVNGAVVLAAPSGDPSRRANTFDNYTVYRERVACGDRVLIVTSSIYLPYQFFIALQALGWRQPLTVEAVGFPPEWMQGVLTGPANVLQELRSGLFAAVRTLEAVRDNGLAA